MLEWRKIIYLRLFLKKHKYNNSARRINIMILQDMSKPLTAAFLNETAAKRFGKKLNLESFEMHQLYDARNRLRTKLHQSQTNETFNHQLSDDEYHKNSLFLDVLNAEISEREAMSEASENTKRPVMETAEDEAELIMAAKDMVDKLTGWMEHTAQMQTETVLSLSDAIRVEKGSQESAQYVGVVKPALEAMYDVMEETRIKLIRGVELLSGQQEYTEMGADEEGMDLDIGDDFSTSEPAKGGENPEGRMRRESRDINTLKKRLDEKKNFGKRKSAV